MSSLVMDPSLCLVPEDPTLFRDCLPIGHRQSNSQHLDPRFVVRVSWSKVPMPSRKRCRERTPKGGREEEVDEDGEEGTMERWWWCKEKRQDKKVLSLERPNVGSLDLQRTVGDWG
jgi:hypothetical protein